MSLTIKMSITRSGLVRFAIPWKTWQRATGSNETERRQLRADVNISGSDNTITILIHPEGEHAVNDIYNYPSRSNTLTPETVVKTVEVRKTKLRLAMSLIYPPMIIENVITEPGQDRDHATLMFTPPREPFTRADSIRRILRRRELRAAREAQDTANQEAEAAVEAANEEVAEAVVDAAAETQDNVDAVTAEEMTQGTRTRRRPPPEPLFICADRASDELTAAIKELIQRGEITHVEVACVWDEGTTPRIECKYTRTR